MKRLLPLAAIPLIGLISLLTLTALLFGGSATPSSAATSDIPPAYLALYQSSAQACSGLSWTVIAAIGKIESDHGRNIHTSSAGAQGPMQILPATFAEYAVDGDHDGRTDIQDPADAIATATNILCQNGAGAGPQQLRQAIYAYNHDLGYVDAVLAQAAAYTAVPPPSPTGPVAAQIPTSASPAAKLALTFALTPPVYGSAYEYGGTGPLYDCSGLVQAAYATAGIVLPRTSQQQWLAGYPTVAATDLQPGDLVFFNPDIGGLPDHVGIYIAGGYMVDDPHTGAFERVEPVAGFGTYMGAIRP